MIFWRIASTFFYLGKLPVAPGSFGSFAALLLWLFLPLDYSIQSMAVIIFFIIGIISSSKIAKELNDLDPPEIIIDEVVGMGIALFMLPHNLILYSLAFIIFRIFDIFKPSFIFTIQKLPNGWGIMLDDVMAGAFTWLICQGIHSIL